MQVGGGLEIGDNKILGVNDRGSFYERYSKNENH